VPQGCRVAPRTHYEENPRDLRVDAVRRFIDLREPTDCECYVAHLTGGKVVGDARLVATAGDVVLGDLQFLYGAPDPAHHWQLRKRRLRWPRALPGKLAMLGASNGDNYYHWLFDSLPRLRLLELAGYPLDGFAGFVMNNASPDFQWQSLARAGIAADRLVRATKRSVLRCEQLVVPSMPGPRGFPAPWLCRYLRELLLPRNPPQATRRIYISRRHARGRKILNEDEMLPLLERQGFDIVHAERLSFDQQISLFASAEEVIAVHGAGLSNLVFAPPGARVLELRSPAHDNECFRTLATRGALRYDSLMLDEAAGDRGTDGRFGNLVMNMDALRAKVER
jgi:capsular polysaccharide biosynthesis protein